MRLFTYQLKLALATLRQKPAFSFSVIAAMGLSLGVMLTVLTLAYVMLIKPLPYPEQDNLYLVNHLRMNTEGEVIINVFDYPTLTALYQKQTSFSESAIGYYGQGVVRSHEEQLKVNATFVSPEWFSLLGVGFYQGRGFEQNEGFGMHQPVVVLSYQFWQQAYGGKSDIIGKKLDIDGVSYVVIGITEQSFVEPRLERLDQSSDVWLPWDFNTISYKKDWWQSYNNGLFFIARSAEYSDTQLALQLKSLTHELLQPVFSEDEHFYPELVDIKVESLQVAVLGNTQHLLYMLLAGVLALVLIAFSNIVNIFIAQAARQHRTLSINAVLGAKKSSIFTQLLMQVAMLMTVAVVLAVVVSLAGFALFRRYLAEFLPRVNELSIHTEMIVLLIVVATLISLAFAYLTLCFINFQQLNKALSGSGKGLGVQVSKRLRNGLIVTQIAIASALIFCSFNLFTDAYEIVTQPLGYEREQLSDLQLTLSESEIPEENSFEAKFALLSQVKTQLEQLPQIQAISSSQSPLSGFMLLAATDVNSRKEVQAFTSFVDEKYFQMLGQQLVLGEYFPSQNQQDRDQLLIINEALARYLVGDLSVQNSPVGRKFDFSNDGSAIYTIVGVVKGIAEPGQTQMPMRMYSPSSPLAASYLLKFENGQSLTRMQIIEAMEKVSPRLSIQGFTSLAEVHSKVVLPEKISVATTLAVSLLAILLAANGLYGILIYSSQIRGVEIATRLAVGAKRRDIIVMMFKELSGALFIGGA